VNVKCAIIDDDQNQINLIEDYIQLIPNLELVNTYTNPIQALAEITTGEGLGILFIDIGMPHMSGLDLANKLSLKVKCIIIITAYPQHALEAFEVSVKQYLVKPVSPLRFTEMVSRIMAEYFPLDRNDEVQDDFLFVQTEEKGWFTKLTKSEIIYIESNRNYIKIITETNSINTHLGMKDVTGALLEDRRFMRVHQSYLVNVTKTIRVTGNTIEFSDEHKVAMSRAHKAKFMAYMDSRMLQRRNLNKES
jgi:DNA-binding LytR/AlgR family response regulator